jgi:protein O-GlcNAc transferase
MRQPKAPELRLLLACARAYPTQTDVATIRGMLNDGVDWTLFAQKTVAHGLAGLAGRALSQVAPDMVPDDILAAFQTFIEQTRASNQVLLDELGKLIELLAAAGVAAIPFKGPVLAMQAFGDLGLREFRDLDFLIHDGDVTSTAKILHTFGYKRQGELTQAQFDLIHRLQGQEILFKEDKGAIEPHTRLTSMKMALDVDYCGLWERARPEKIFGHTMLTLAPEDTLIVLAIHGGKELWWDIKWVCDVADFVSSHPRLDWNTIIKRAQAQGCQRMLLVATSLARNYLGARIPNFIAAVESADPLIEPMIGRIIARWEMDDPGGPPSNKTLSMDRLRLHDGVLRQASYIARTVFLPGPQHIPLIALPRFLNFAYIPIGLAHDLVALPMYRGCRRLVAQTNRILAVSPIALALAPVSAQTRKKIQRLQQTYKKARREVDANPGDCLAWIVMGDVLSAMKRHQEAVAAYDRSIALVPDQDSIWRKRKAAIDALKQAGDHPDLSEEPQFYTDDANGWAVRAGFLSFCGRHAEAAEACARALTLNPGHGIAARIGIYSRMLVCDWSNREADQRVAKEGLLSGKIVLRPLTLKQISDSEPDCMSATRLWTERTLPSREPLWRGERYQHDKIRIAYLSTDFRSHPVGAAIIAPLELHDKSRFEVTAISLIPSNSSMRHRIKAAVDRFVDVKAMGDGIVAEMLRDLEIDIAIDLNGLTGSRRTGILAQRPAPLQVNYLGYPGTTASSFMDYIIADHTVIPEENRLCYSEKIAYLPNAYLPYDMRRPIAQWPPTRTEAGLPETGFVFACFNRLQKISPDIFDAWMRLLLEVGDSVLWLPSDDPVVMVSLRREAAARGVAPERLVFAEYAKRAEDHLARQQLADLFVDTLPYNAHSTAGDALWAGLPVLTCLGQAFQARVAGSLLYAVGLPELVTASLAEYEQRAINLARDPVQLAAIRQKLMRNRDTTALFDMAGFTRDLEAVFTTMWERQQSGLPPDDFSIARR